MNCNQFPPGFPNCQSIQVIEPDSTLPVTTLPSPGFDPSLSESGEQILDVEEAEVTVTFTTPKAGDYRFEYLYIDALGIAFPGAIPIVPVNQTIYGFTVDLAGFPLADGYILRWRVVVVSVTQIPGTQIDAPESIRAQLPQAAVFTANFVNPRSITTYGFSELRVENLIDLPQNQNATIVQVVAKTLVGFTVGIWPTPRNNNYFLVARTP